MKQERIPLGSDIKVLVEVSDLGDDVTLDGIAYSLKFTSGKKTKTFSTTMSGTTQTLGTGLTRIDDDSVSAAISASDLDKGSLYLRAELSIPDTDFSGNVRTEVREVDLNITIC